MNMGVSLYFNYLTFNEHTLDIILLRRPPRSASAALHISFDQHSQAISSQLPLRMTFLLPRPLPPACPTDCAAGVLVVVEIHSSVVAAPLSSPTPTHPRFQLSVSLKDFKNYYLYYCVIVCYDGVLRWTFICSINP